VTDDDGGFWDRKGPTDTAKQLQSTEASMSTSAGSGAPQPLPKQPGPSGASLEGTQLKPIDTVCPILARRIGHFIPHLAAGPRRGVTGRHATATNTIHLGLFDLQNRTFGPYLMTVNRVLIPAMAFPPKEKQTCTC
jgi:hypothetical protein